MRGILYAIGVGPGAADLLTLRAVDALKKTHVVLTAASPKNDYSIALDTARPHLRPDCETLRLEFPMTRNRDVLEEAWGLAAEKTLAVLESGRNAAFLTLGDPLVYSTFAYLHRHLKRIAPDAQVEIVPGITSFQAACARAGLSLCEGEDNVRIVSGINDAAVLEREIADADTAVILKAYRNFPAIASALEKLGRARTSLCVSHVEQEKEEIRQGVDAGRKPPYMTLIISKK